jgi:hypothetical protein
MAPPRDLAAALCVGVMGLTGEGALLNRLPTSALLARVEAHIDRLDQVLRDSEELLDALNRGERDDLIRQLDARLAGALGGDANGADRQADDPARPFYRA